VNRRPIRWRATWALAQITGVILSSAVWTVLAAATKEFVIAALLTGVIFVVGSRTCPVLWLAFGARPAAPADRDAVLRAIIPVASLRGRNQPRVLVAKGHRAAGWDFIMPSSHIVLVSKSMLAEIRACKISDAEVSALVAHTLGQLPALGSRAVLAIEIYCLPWAITKTAAGKIAHRLARAPLISFSWRMRPVVFGLGLLDALQHGRWEAAIPLLVLAVLTYTTKPLNQAWARKLDELGDRRVTDEGLGPEFANTVVDWRDPAGVRHTNVRLEAQDHD
jgi:hypothetical protein